MASSKNVSDVAFQLKDEGQRIELAFNQGVPNTNQGTVEWNIPSPSLGCDAKTRAYAGMVILLSKTPMDASNIPQNGVVYTADATADFDLSTADRIGDALVIGAFYECDLKSNIDNLTKSLVVSDIVKGDAYYVAGYAVDCQNRYHSDGVRAYSDEYGANNGDSTPAMQVVSMGGSDTCISPTDGTNLVPGVDYEFDLIVDDTFPDAVNANTVEITIDGINAGTYQALLDEINKGILLAENPTQSPSKPNTGVYLWKSNDSQLYQYDGDLFNPIYSINYESDPSIVNSGTFWFNDQTSILQKYSGSPLSLSTSTYVVNDSDPLNPSSGTYWFNGTQAYRWNDVTWCEQTTLISNVDPSACPVIPALSYWYDATNSVLYKWDSVTEKWNVVDAIFWPDPLNNLPNGTYWYDSVNVKLYIMVSGSWQEITTSVAFQEDAPLTPNIGDLWFKPSTEELYEYISGSPSDVWVQRSVLIWDTDPTLVTSCDIWWNSNDDNLYIWDSVNSQWDLITSFYQTSIDPALAPVIDVYTVWYDNINNKFYVWEGNIWVETQYIDYPTDPITTIVQGVVWYNKGANLWYEYDGSGWVLISPIYSTFDLTAIPDGTYWFDTDDMLLYVRSLSSWVQLGYVTDENVNKKKDLWFNTTDGILYEWNGISWVKSTPIATAYFNDNCGITFSTKALGSSAAIIIPVPEGANVGTTLCSLGTGFAYYGTTDASYTRCEFYANNIGHTYPARAIPNNSFLWSNLSTTASITQPTTGVDSVSKVPMYMELGVGTDGTPDERRRVIDDVLAQLGYPAVEVELTQKQLDLSVDLALRTLRQRSGASVKRGFYFLDISPGKQHYVLTNKVLGYHKISNIGGVFRFNSAFLSSTHSSGVYGQVVLQHLYTMGAYDLTSFFLMSQYVEQLEQLFATRLTFGWNEQKRVLSLYSSFTRVEKVMIDCMTERTEQELLSDRLTGRWIQRYALAEAMFMLAQIRGKFSSLPGAGGGISLNASELSVSSDALKTELLAEIDDFVVDTPEDVGLSSTIILG